MFLLNPETPRPLKAIVEFVVAQSERPGLGQIDPDLFAEGKELFKTGKATNFSFTACADCHALKVVGTDESLGDGAGAGYPTLTGYGGKAWLKSFIKNPASDSLYGAEHNLMPGFEGKISERELDQLVDWMVGDYFRSKKTKE